MNTLQSHISLFGGRRFNSYSGYFRRLFGGRLQKVALNGGFTCPNRDGLKGLGGCTFCNNGAFTPSYCDPVLSITEQLEEGMLFHRRRYKRAHSYLAYFQSFSNTYGPLDRLRLLYDEALRHPAVSGVVIGTRPDCVDDAKLDYFAALAARTGKYIALEYGVESCYDQTLERINRCHSFSDARWAIEASAARGLHVGAHFILGLPGESDDMLRSQMSLINSLPLSSIKFHQLQLFKHTAMAAEYDRSPESFRWWSLEGYLAFFIDLLELLRPDIVMERFASEAPPRYHHGPNWGLVRNERLMEMFEAALEARDTYQGRLYGV